MGVGTLIILHLLHLAASFSPKPFTVVSSQYGRRWTTTTLFVSRPDASSAAARAGESGYSVLRQPVQWDTETDPTFDAPTSLEENNGMLIQDEAWWMQGRGRDRETNSKEERNKSSQTSLPSMRMPTVQTPSSQQELDLFQRTLDTLDYPILLNALMRECTTVPARELVAEAMQSHPENTKHKKNRVMLNKNHIAHQPLTAGSAQGVDERYAAVREMQLLLQNDNLQLLDATYTNRKRQKVSLGPPPLQGLSFPLVPLLEQANSGGVLQGPELLEILSMLNVLEDVSLWSSNGLLQLQDSTLEFQQLPKLAAQIQVNATLQELLQNAFDDQQRLSSSTFPTLGEWRAKVRTLRSDILQSVQSLLTTPSIASKLAMESGGAQYSEVNGRIVFPMDSDAAAPMGIVHDTSRSGKTLYVEPTELVGPTNALRQAEAELRAEEARIWRLLTLAVLENRADLEASVFAVGQLDLVQARVLLGKKWQGVIPQVGTEGIVSLRNAKHPVLLLRELPDVVGSDVDLGANGNQGLVLTGPNSGGKTVILKLLGLVALMARNGIPVPADAASATHTPRVDFFSPVLADIGDLQSVGGDLSTFSGHMLVCREVLKNSGENALVLMDELGSGTDPRQGVAIAQALLEALLETGARVAITTHFLELKQLAASDHRFSVGGMQFVNGRPTYKLLPGTVGESFALAVAERLELPSSVLARANELLDQETRQMGDLLRDLEDQKALVDQQAAELAEKRQEMAELNAQLKREQARLEQKQLVARRDEAKKFAKMLEEKERVLEEVLEKLKSDPSRKVVARGWDDIRFVKRDALTEAENVPSVMARKKKAKQVMEQTYSELVPLAEMRDKPDLQVGDKLMVCKKGSLFGKEAEVLRLGNRLEVEVSGMVLQVKMTEVALPNSNVQVHKPTQQEGPKNRAKAAERAIQAEQLSSTAVNGSKNNEATSKAPASSLSIRTVSNTIDVRGCNLEEAKSKCQARFSSCLMSGRTVVYVLHGHGEAGVLKRKLRDWLKSERKVVKRSGPADPTDGGDAFTKVELR